MTEKELVKLAMKARTMAYIPYSNHGVGAALECEDRTVFLGCNIENAAYTPSNCAERTAFFKAVSEGKLSFRRIAVVGGMNHLSQIMPCAPCGVCRQVMMEFCDPKTFQIILAAVSHADDVDAITDADIETEIYTLEEILPKGFGPTSLK